MGTFSVKGMEDLTTFFDNMAAIPYYVIEEMLDKQADVVVDAQRKTALTMLSGPHNKGAVKQAIKKGKTKRLKNGLVKHITFNGSQHGTRIAEIAFLNEYGKKGQPARPFIKAANEACSEQTQAAADKVFDDWLDTL